MRRDRINKTKKDLNFKINDCVILKDRSEVLGVSKKLKAVYSRTPFIVEKAGQFNSIQLKR